MNIQNVCALCFDDADLSAWIKEQNGPIGCDVCKQSDAPTVDLYILCEYFKECLSIFWGTAIEQLPYDGREGGYQGTTWTTDELIFDSVGLELTRDNNGLLFSAICEITCDDEPWCDYDWLTLDEDDALRFSWESFSKTVKHERRFFLHYNEKSSGDSDPHSSLRLLSLISDYVEEFGLIHQLETGKNLWRARDNIADNNKIDAQTFGPPPRELATQSNRMNPPGIPMLYVAEKPQTAVLEIRQRYAKVGQFKLARNAVVLDLTTLPKIPGIFSKPDRFNTLILRFIHHFTTEIIKPVARTDRTHIDYIPSQVVTEYFRDHKFKIGMLDGIRFPSAADPGENNIVLFIDTLKPKSSEILPNAPSPMLTFLRWEDLAVK